MIKETDDKAIEMRPISGVDSLLRPLGKLLGVDGDDESKPLKGALSSETGPPVKLELVTELKLELP